MMVSPQYSSPRLCTSLLVSYAVYGLFSGLVSHWFSFRLPLSSQTCWWLAMVLVLHITNPSTLPAPWGS